MNILLQVVILFLVASSLIIICNFDVNGASPKLAKLPTIGIKIISPTAGKEIPTGNLTIMGMSSDDENTNCSVSVDWNNLKPFQNAVATGPYGNNDYSTWTYTYSPAYHNIMQGTNELTSKLTCARDGNITTKWYSVNVTGIEYETKHFADETAVKTNTPVNTNTPMNANAKSMSANNIAPIEGKFKILPQFGTSSLKEIPLDSDRKISSSSDTTKLSEIPSKPKLSNLLMKVALSRLNITSADPQTINVKVTDAGTLKQIPGANVNMKIIDSKGASVNKSGTTDSLGQYSYSWKADPSLSNGQYKVITSVSRPGYEHASQTSSFQKIGQLLVGATLEKSIVKPGESQTINVKVTDFNTLKRIPNALVSGTINNQKFSTMTDNSGVTSYSWTTSPTGGGNNNNIVLAVSTNGYNPITKSLTYSMGEPLYLLGSKPPQHLISDNTASAKNDYDEKLVDTLQNRQIKNPTLPENPCDVLNGRSNFDRCRAALDTGNQGDGNIKVHDTAKHDFLGSLTNLVTG